MLEAICLCCGALTTKGPAYLAVLRAQGNKPEKVRGFAACNHYVFDPMIGDSLSDSPMKSKTRPRPCRASHKQLPSCEETNQKSFWTITYQICCSSVTKSKIEIINKLRVQETLGICSKFKILSRLLIFCRRKF